MCGDSVQQPYVNRTKRKFVRDTITFKGLNRREALGDDEFLSMKNLSSDAAPYVTTRAPRELIETLTAPNGVFSNGIKLATVDGTSFKYDGVVKGTVTDGEKVMVNMNGNIVIFPDKKYYDYVGDTFGSFSAPDLDYVCEWNNRLWGVADGDSYIYACKQGDFTDWTVETDELQEPYWVETGGNSAFKGIASYNGHVTAFKADQMMEIYGNKPSNFQVIEGAKNGLLDNQAITEVESILYFLSNKGVMVYTGGQPDTISYPLDLFHISGAFGTDKKKAYMCMYDGSYYGLYVFDPFNGLWHKEDDIQVMQFAYHLDSLYALCSDGKLYKFNSGTETIEWELETKEYSESAFEKKEYHSVNLKLRLYEGSSANVYIKLDDGAYTLQKTITYVDGYMNEYIIPMNVTRCKRFQIKMTGTGKFVLYHMQREFTAGSKV